MLANSQKGVSKNQGPKSRPHIMGLFIPIRRPTERTRIYRNTYTVNIEALLKAGGSSKHIRGDAEPIHALRHIEMLLQSTYLSISG